jgi:mono/diheme cytochrome c family protein
MKLAQARRAVAALAALGAVAFGAATSARAQDAVAGKLLFDDTAAASGINSLTGSCKSCHGTVENRRAKIAGDANAEIDLTLASDRLRVAIASVATMSQFDALSPTQVQDIAAYLADTPRRSAAQLDLTAGAVNVPSPVLPVDLRHAVATTRGLLVTGVAVTGPGAARFTRGADSCDQQTLQPGATCRVTVGYAAPDTAGATATLTFALRETGAASGFTREVALNGVAATAQPPAPPASAAVGDSGGGSLGGAWLAGLGMGVALLGWRRRRGA